MLPDGVSDYGDCPSCGAPIKGDVCEFCGRMFKFDAKPRKPAELPKYPPKRELLDRLAELGVESSQLDRLPNTRLKKLVEAAEHAERLNEARRGWNWKLPDTQIYMLDDVQVQGNPRPLFINGVGPITGPDPLIKPGFFLL